MSDVKIHYKGGGPMELEREDGWFYRLHGVVVLDQELGYDGHYIVTVTVRDVSDKTLDSIRVLRDAFPHTILAIQTDNY